MANGHLSKADDSNLACRAPVPTVVHQALRTANLIEDSFYRDNELDQMWIGATDWIYEREFWVDETLLAHEKVLLRCHGLDTLATVIINGTEIARADVKFEDNFFNLLPNKPRTIVLEGAQSVRLDDLRISSLWDTFA